MLETCMATIFRRDRIHSGFSSCWIWDAELEIRANTQLLISLRGCHGVACTGLTKWNFSGNLAN